MSISTLRRQVKNVAYNFSDAQVKVREATSNDPWGPTTALMSEIADLTHNPIAFTEIMSMLWKRLNDHGKNWRHVYKSLVLLDYLIKCGSEKVAQQCRENFYTIETLKDFQHIEDNRDQGLNVREKAKQMIALINDEERLRNERARFLLTRKRFIQNGSAISSDGTVRSVRRAPETGVIDSELEEARPSSLGEEEMQLQIAMALSREECEKEEELRKGDAIRLQIALEESKRQTASGAAESSSSGGQKMISSSALSQNALEDLLSLGIGEPVLVPTNNSPAPSTSAQAFGNPSSAIIDPWSPQPSSSSLNNANSIYPSLASSSVASAPNIIPPPASNDPWSPVLPPASNSNADCLIPLSSTNNSTTSSTLVQNDPWAAFENSTTNKSSTNGLISTTSPTNSHNNILSVNSTTPPNNTNNNTTVSQQRPNVKTPESFLGENSALVNLDNLMGPTNFQSKPASNPFMIGSSIPPTTNPFAAQQRPSPSLHEMMQAQRGGSLTPGHKQTQSHNNPSSSVPVTNPFAF